MRFIIREPLFVTDIYEHKVVVSGRKLPSGEAVTETENQGWFMRVGLFSVFIGFDRPMGNVRKGQKARLIIELEDEQIGKEI